MQLSQMSPQQRKNRSLIQERLGSAGFSSMADDEWNEKHDSYMVHEAKMMWGDGDAEIYFQYSADDECISYEAGRGDANAMLAVYHEDAVDELIDEALAFKDSDPPMSVEEQVARILARWSKVEIYDHDRDEWLLIVDDADKAGR